MCGWLQGPGTVGMEGEVSVTDSVVFGSDTAIHSTGGYSIFMILQPSLKAWLIQFSCVLIGCIR